MFPFYRHKLQSIYSWRICGLSAFSSVIHAAVNKILFLLTWVSPTAELQQPRPIYRARAQKQDKAQKVKKATNTCEHELMLINTLIYFRSVTGCDFGPQSRLYPQNLLPPELLWQASLSSVLLGSEENQNHLSGRVRQGPTAAS